MPLCGSSAPGSCCHKVLGAAYARLPCSEFLSSGHSLLCYKGCSIKTNKNPALSLAPSLPGLLTLDSLGFPSGFWILPFYEARMAPCSLSKISYLHALACAIWDTGCSLSMPHLCIRYSLLLFIHNKCFTGCLLGAQLCTRCFHVTYLARSSCQPCKGRTVTCI